MNFTPEPADIYVELVGMIALPGNSGTFMEVKLETGFVNRTLEPSAATRRPFAPADQVTLSATTALRGALVAEPETRPSEVARGRELFLSAAYPPEALIKNLSNLLAQKWPESDFLE